MNLKNKMEECIRNGDRDTFNRLVEENEGQADLSDVDLRNLDLSGFSLKHANLKNAYLRNTNLAGVDLRRANLEGVSIKSARVSGAYFPDHLPAGEIMLSLNHGTRIRCPIDSP